MIKVSKSSIKKVVLWVVGGVVLWLAAYYIGVSWGVFSWTKDWLDRYRRGEVEVSQTGVADEQGNMTVEYSLTVGWNLVAFPVEPYAFATAGELAVDVAQKGGYVTTISRWDGDQWQDYVIRGNQAYGDDFNILPGKAYFLKNEKVASWSVTGRAITREELADYQLSEGWNTLGLVVDDYTARKVIDEINQGEEKATVMDWWTESSNWELFVKRLYSAEKVEEYGENFAIQKIRGYMIFVNQAVDWRPNVGN